MYIHNIDPILIDLGFFEIRWYSLAYIFGILIGWWLGKKIFTFKEKYQGILLRKEIFDDLVACLIISIILGGRIGYVLFYNLDYYIDNPISIFKIWEGGMSFHGGLLGVVIGIWLFAKQNKTNFFLFADIIATVAPIGLLFGRLANFINSELYGQPTNVYWSVIFPKIDNISRHPSQLYEAFLEGLLLFVILLPVAFSKKKINGLSSSLFLILYGIFRIFSERFREPDTQIGYLFNTVSMGTFLSLIMIIFGGLILIKNKDELFK